jgi:hypothetical protein
MARGLKPHNSSERKRVVDALAPLIKKHLGRNLIALAITGSLARGDDGAYSDIEMFAFVSRTPEEDSAIQFIYQGLLIEIWLLTRSEYLGIFKDKVRSGGHHPWPYVALNVLTPVFNEQFVLELSRIPPPSEISHCRTAFVSFWPKLQEATAKLLTAVSRNDVEPVLFLYWQTVEKSCYALSLLNGRPFSTRAAVFREAQAFPLLPEHFKTLLIRPEDVRSPKQLSEAALLVFEEIEQLALSQGMNLYPDRLDFFVSPKRLSERITRRLGLHRVVQKLRKVLSR